MLPSTRLQATPFPPSGRLTPASQLVRLSVGPRKNLPKLLGQNILPKPGLRVPGQPQVHLLRWGLVHSRGLPEPIR